MGVVEPEFLLRGDVNRGIREDGWIGSGWVFTSVLTEIDPLAGGVWQDLADVLNVVMLFCGGKSVCEDWVQPSIVFVCFFCNDCSSISIAFPLLLLSSIFPKDTIFGVPLSSGVAEWRT